MKELINDLRLTPTMERVRSGRVQLFRERNPKDKSFINNDNADVVIQHERKEMYAKLIDGKWYWVNGCAECNGEPRDWSTYIECEDHDRCNVCETKRGDIEGTPWGRKTGWICNSCKEKEDLEIRRKAFEKLDGELPDCLYQDDIICPHCGSELDKDEVYEDQELDCHVCGGELHLEIVNVPIYCTYVKGERITE